MPASTLSCPRCGAPLSEGVDVHEFEGLCPGCLATLAVGEESDVLRSSPGKETGSREPEPPPLKNGSTFKDFEVLELIGRGGMSTVYKARQIRLDRIVALKILSPRLASDREFALRFDREARALAALDHPHIVGVYDMGVEAGLYYLAMEYVDGVNLRALLARKTVTSAQALRIVPQLCDALEYAHSRGIVHRDIKPENILIDPGGSAKIADFGIAKIVREGEGATALTETNVVMGTAEYMAPEQRDRTRSVDHRADIYSLGVVLYELLTGELPVGRFELPSRRVRVDVRIDDVVLRALESNPTRRYQKAAQMGTDVHQVLTSGGSVSTECAIVDLSNGTRLGTSPDRRLAVRAVACALAVRGWDKDEIGIRVAGDYQFDGASAMPLLQSQVETSRMDVFVPRGVDLEVFSDEAGVEIASVVGSASAEIPEGELKISSFQGSLRIRGGAGPVLIDELRSESFRIASESGRVEVRDLELSRGRGEIETESGDVAIRPGRSASFRFSLQGAPGMVPGSGEGRIAAGSAFLSVRSAKGLITLSDPPPNIFQVSSFGAYLRNLPKKELEALGIFVIVSAGLLLIFPGWSFIVVGIWGMVLAVRLWKGYVHQDSVSLSVFPESRPQLSPSPPPPPPPPPPRPKTSATAVFGLLFGILGALLTGGSTLAILILDRSVDLGIQGFRPAEAFWASFILGAIALGCAATGLLFSLTGASGITEARGALKARGAAHAGAFFSIAALLVLSVYVRGRLDGLEAWAEGAAGLADRAAVITLDAAAWGVIYLAGLVLIGFIVRTVLAAFRKGPSEVPALPRLSGFAVLSFLCGLGVMAVLLAVTVLYSCETYDSIIRNGPRDVSSLALARSIVSYCILVPALGAIGFALAARASVKEGNGEVRGRAFYRAGTIMAFLPGALLLAA